MQWMRRGVCSPVQLFINVLCVGQPFQVVAARFVFETSATLELVLFEFSRNKESSFTNLPS